jgi:hypothetical protein
MPVYKEPTMPWLNGALLVKYSNLYLRDIDFVLEESSWVNESLGISVAAAMESLPGLSPFLHVSVRNHKRELTLEEIKYVKEFFFPKQFVSVIPTNYLPGPKTYHLKLVLIDEILSVSNN